MKAIFGYGSPHFSLGNLRVQFAEHHGAGKVSFEPVVHEYTTLSGREVEVFDGWRAKVVFHLYNLRSLDYECHLKLLNIINVSKQTGQPIMCQPRFDLPIRLTLRLVLKSPVNFEEITNLNAGQTIDLEFVSYELLDAIPAFVNVPGYLLVGSDYLSLGGGDRLIIPEKDYQEWDGTTSIEQ